jgi:hypothetical protein
MEDGKEEEHVRVQYLLLGQLQQTRFLLFLTKRELLVAIDGTLEEPFFPRLDDGTGVLTDEGAVWAWGSEGQGGLLSLLDDLLSDDDECSDNEDGSGRGGGGAGRDNEGRPGGGQWRYEWEVDYSVFAADIWPCIKPASSPFNPSLVWSEIVSFIKGSMDSVDRRNGRLTLEEYQKLGAKRSPNFTGDQRSEVYDLFLKYESKMAALNAFNVCDLVRHIYRGIKEMGGYRGERIHSTFVDEVQDFTKAEMKLIMSVSAMPNGFFLTGDTAQTIARGLSFRFSDLRSVFHLAAQSSTTGANAPKEIYKLVNNYRTHSGVLNLANAAVELIEHHFPLAIDKLEHDKGLFEGPKPRIMGKSRFEDLCLLLLGSNLTSGEIEFGAQQVIIVRTEDSKRQLPEELKCSGLVCTVMESKGLEFDDVLLRNFFTDSETDGEWRAITKYCQDRPPDQASEHSLHEMLALLEAAGVSGDHKPRPLAFDLQRHKILLDELRHLYTAVTRARVNVWIYEESASKCRPMFDFLIRNGLVDVMSGAEMGSNTAGLTKGTSTSTADWDRQGHNLLAKKACFMAAHCFLKANNTSMYSLALAQHHVMEALKEPKDSEPFQANFRMAADLFLAARTKQGSVGVIIEAAKCCKYAGAPGMASKLFDMFARCSYSEGTVQGVEAAARAWRLAAKIAEEAGEHKQAA